MNPLVVPPHALWTSWSFEPAVVGGIVAMLSAYAVGVRRLWSRGRGRGVTVWQTVSFSAGVLVLVVALVSPLDGLAETLFSAHMVQHLLLILGAPPLLVAGSAGSTMALALPLSMRRRLRTWERHAVTRGVTGTIARPVPVLILHITALYIWHLPVMYQAALRSNLIHGLEHASFSGTALLFWWLIIDEKGQRRLGDGPAVVFVFISGLASGGLGALLTFAPTALYPMHALGARLWGLTPLQDQQLAGLIMWVPAGVVYVLAAAVLFLRWMSKMDAAVAGEGSVVG
ncbi:MAG: cytochrome c oxidase assembly protein [Actinomycetota bacterium]|nr:cytochrome c oxidase assembly protein [Actinomycetota bacterium]